MTSSLVQADELSARPLRWTGQDDAPFPIPSVIPASAYTDPEQYAAEIEVMRRHWLLVCHSGQVREKGDTFLAEQLGDIIAVVRQGGGSLLAWHAICQHRSTALLKESRSGARRFTCPYHHWTYGLDGKLIAATQRECFRPEQLEGIRLPPVHVEEFEGWVWINTSETPPPFDDWLGELADEWRPYQMADAKLMADHIDIVLPASWKRVAEAFIEVYHVNICIGKARRETL